MRRSPLPEMTGTLRRGWRRGIRCFPTFVRECSRVSGPRAKFFTTASPSRSVAAWPAGDRHPPARPRSGPGTATLTGGSSTPSAAGACREAGTTGRPTTDAGSRSEYAIANKLGHPVTVYLRETSILKPLEIGGNRRSPRAPATTAAHRHPTSKPNVLGSSSLQIGHTMLGRTAGRLHAAPAKPRPPGLAGGVNRTVPGPRPFAVATRPKWRLA
jgi:hypothetical protein